MTNYEKPTIGWITGEHILNGGISYGWRCTHCRNMNVHVTYFKWSSVDVKCKNCKADHTLEINSENIRY